MPSATGPAHSLAPGTPRPASHGVSASTAVAPPTAEAGEGQILPVGVDHHIEVDVLLRGAVQVEGQAARVIRHVDGRADAAPAHVVTPEPAAAQRAVDLAARDHA